MTESTKRKEFIEEFLKLYKVKSVTYSKIESDRIFGNAIYDFDDPEEQQEFCWRMSEENVPNRAVLELIKIINANGYCDIDRITISENELFEKTKWQDRKYFDECFDKIFDIEIMMIDEGEETDSFFVHT